MLFSDDASLRADEMYMPRHRRCRCSSGEGVGFGVRMMPWFVVGHARLPPVPLFDDGSGLLAEATSKHDGDSDDDTCGARCASGPRRDDGKVMGERGCLFVGPLCRSEFLLGDALEAKLMCCVALFLFSERKKWHARYEGGRY